MKSNVRLAAITCVIVLFVWESPAHAYLDPGSGSLLLQTLIAGALAGMYAVKRFWRKIREAVGAALSRFARHG
jgi:hypothetical protein